MSPDAVIWGGGTAGLILVLLLVGRELWADHKRKDLKTEQERDEAMKLAQDAVEGTSKITDGLTRLTALIERQATRRRQYDADDNGRTARPNEPKGSA